MEERILTKQQKEERLKNIDKAIVITQDFVSEMKNIPKNKLKELNELQENLLLLKDYNKLENKIKYLDILELQKKEMIEKIKEEP